ncbi:MAG: hypothetical protein GWO16_09250 [Gammaproteobacteria bacterium]|nr:hypothetical protein [Gammaproteobacteria bacterium]NIR98153.1 hypothetical protein [Gammaproteobacteria bacterium]NIT62540.1 hypothetical protein [Gammaproteobacteria bacterium]NIV20797.1 hypothetical protein [Gammaproteobacteria bacterium]NIY31120.1 hypothetical protein [Gammaproteobacteria bacterium]
MQHDRNIGAGRDGRCELCGRAVPELTRHHLIPRARHGKRRTQRRFAREEMRAHILWVCRPCHKHVHAVCSETSLEARYNTRERLLEHPDIRRFIEWIRSKPAGYLPRTYSKKG